MDVQNRFLVMDIHNMLRDVTCYVMDALDRLL